MFRFGSPQVAQRSRGFSKLTKELTARIQNGFHALADTVPNTMKRTNRQLSSKKPEIPTELCPHCVECVLDRSQHPVHDIRFVTSLSLVFDGICLQQELHVAEILGMMRELCCLELLDVRITPNFYTMLAERAQFQLGYFACGSPLSDSLLRFLSTQRHLLKFIHLARSLETKPTTRVCGQGVLYTAQKLSTTASLLLHPQLDTTSLRHLEYIGGQSLREEIRAIEKIYRLGPQLRSLRFMWGTGRTETFLDVTKFVCIATNTPSIKHIYLSEMSRDIFEQFIVVGLGFRTWKKLQTLIWVPDLPRENDLDEPKSLASLALLSSADLTELSDMIKTVPQPRRQFATPSWYSTSYTIPPRSANSSLTASISPRRTRSSSISDINRVDLSFPIHCIGQDLMDAFPSLRRFALWNWDRMVYDLLTRTATGDLLWTYHVDIGEDEWLSV